MGRPKGRRTRAVQRRPDSFAARLDAVLLPYVAENMGTPSTIALALSAIMGVPITRQQVWHALNDNLYTRKTQSPVKGFAHEDERVAFLQELDLLWTRADQVFIFSPEPF